VLQLRTPEGTITYSVWRHASGLWQAGCWSLVGLPFGLTAKLSAGTRSEAGVVLDGLGLPQATPWQGCSPVLLNGGEAAVRLG